jgi:hypothetical protein
MRHIITPNQRFAPNSQYTTKGTPMNRIVTPQQSPAQETPQGMPPGISQAIAPADQMLTVLSPLGTPPKINRKQAATRPESLDGKTVYLVDCRFDDSIELLKQVAAWFAANMPSVKTKIVSLSATYQKDDPKTWNEIKDKRPCRDHRRRPLQQLRAGGRHPRDHTRDQVRRADGGAAHRQVRQGGPPR